MAARPGTNPFAAGLDAIQTMMSGNLGQQPWAASAMPSFAGAPAAPEAGWWWLPAVKPEAFQAAAMKWFSPQTDVTALAAADRRFRGEAWQSQPFFQAVRDQYLRTSAFWRDVVEHADLDDRERHRAKFLEQFSTPRHRATSS